MTGRSEMKGGPRRTQCGKVSVGDSVCVCVCARMHARTRVYWCVRLKEDCARTICNEA